MNTHRGRGRLPLLLVGVLVMAPVPTAQAATKTVIERGTQFEPKQVEVAVGDTVVWSYESGPSGSSGHTVTFDDGRDLNQNCPGIVINDCQSRPGQTVSRSFPSAGTFPYHCKIHGASGGRGMSGIVIVAAAGTSSTVPSSSTTTTAKATNTSSTTSTTARATSSTTSTTRVLATSSTVVKSTTTSSGPAILEPGAAPSFSPEDSSTTATGDAAGGRGSGGGGSDAGTVALIVGLLLAVAGGGGFLLWRLRPGRG